jgi:hypothetical protein
MTTALTRSLARASLSLKGEGRRYADVVHPSPFREREARHVRVRAV